MALATSRSFLLCRRLFFNAGVTSSLQNYSSSPSEAQTHTGQKFNDDDYRKARFVDKEKLVNTRFAIDLIAEDPVVVCKDRVVSSHAGGPLGHPKVYINLDAPGVHTCGYSGRKFVLEKYYDAASMGKSITFAEYLEEASTHA